uniref:Uncharacterized protein n=1 Tax=Glossina austeni TaxID=7395 RepID=A0A1A9V4P1_GLOAU
MTSLTAAAAAKTEAAAAAVAKVFVVLLTGVELTKVTDDGGLFAVGVGVDPVAVKSPPKLLPDLLSLSGLTGEVRLNVDASVCLPCTVQQSGMEGQTEAGMEEKMLYA